MHKKKVDDKWHHLHAPANVEPSEGGYEGQFFHSLAGDSRVGNIKGRQIHLVSPFHWMLR